MNRYTILTLMMIIVMPLLTGCFGGGGGGGSSNPLASVVTNSDAALAPEAGSTNLVACRYAKSVSPKYTFAKSNYKVSYSHRAGLKKALASLKIMIKGAGSADNIFITFDKLVVKSDKGVKSTFTMPSRKIDLLAAGQLSEVLADLELAPGFYKQLEISIKSAELIDNNQTYNLVIPSKKIRFNGSFEIRDGYSTNLTILFNHRLLKVKVFGHYLATMIPVVKISSELVLKPVDPQITDGELNGTVENFVNAQKLSGVTVSLDGTDFSAVTDADGAFSFAKVPAGIYNLKSSHPDYLDYSLSVAVEAGQVAAVNIQINPAVISSSVANTGWFSKIYPFADANGQYAEVALETPVNIDFISLAFVKAEMKFTAEYYATGSTRCLNYLSTTQQVSALADLGDWWAGNTAIVGSYLGEFYCTTTPGTTYTVDVTELIRSNPSSTYFMASKNIGLVNIKLTNIQLSVYYR